MDPTTQYAIDVIAGRIPACRYVILACKRHINDLQREDIWFDPKAADRFFRFCTKLKHYKGPMRGQPLHLLPWEQFVFGNIYGWKRCEFVDGNWIHTEEWKYHFAYIEVPRKNGKTTLCAAGAAYDCAMLDETGAEVYIVATKEDQAKIMFNDVKAYINQSEDMTETFEILLGSNYVYARESMRTSFIKPLGSDSQRLDGLNPFSTYKDELHAWPDRELWDVVENAYGARLNWHDISITTSGNNQDGICFIERDHLIRVLEGEEKKDDKFGIIYTVDQGEKLKWRDEDVWRKANPSLGYGKSLEYMRSKAEKADQVPSSLPDFLNKQLDIWTDVAEAWLDSDIWNALGAEFTLQELATKSCKVGFDLARVGDLSAVTWLFPIQKGVVRMVVYTHYYLPDFDIANRERNDKMAYRQYAEDGWLTLTPGKTTNYEFIREDIARTGEIVDVTGIGYDRHFAGELIQWLQGEGFELVPIAQTPWGLTSGSQEFERHQIEGTLVHNNNPLMNWNVRNVAISKDSNGNIKPDKLKSKKRIDGIISTVNCFAQIVAPPELKKAKTPYNKRGLRTL